VLADTLEDSKPMLTLCGTIPHSRERVDRLKAAALDTSNVEKK
jgi:hypothetical protein